MPSGRLGAATLAADTDTVLYTVPVSTVATVNVAVVNRGSTAAVVNLAIAPADAPALADYIEYGVTIPAQGVLERTAIVAGAGERVVVRSTTADCSVRVHGFEEVA
ncbi:hypothetical protein IEG05_19700 [Pseudomonas kunmingensis]|uniref:hypothetical protein n=1 Tax=Stutzerimonas kunmingensis TaxID=1211807 RepID=UPI0017460FE0|nr:hypothetical protein [Stutzerimonas kunmingensis]MBD3877433.1 hypothetical protein [Stutzerimonas kunmingensis]